MKNKKLVALAVAVTLVALVPVAKLVSLVPAVQEWLRPDPPRPETKAPAVSTPSCERSQSCIDSEPPPKTIELPDDTFPCNPEQPWQCYGA